MTKVCGHCKKEKDISKFNKDKYTKDGLDNWCKQCRSEYRIKYNKEIYEENIRKEKDNIKTNINEKEIKICIGYRQEKLISEFSKDRYNKDGLRNLCRKRGSIKGKKYRAENYEKIIEKMRKYHRDNPLKMMIFNCISRSKLFNVPCDSYDSLYNCLEPIYELYECMKCHCKLEHGDKNITSPSIDRIMWLEM